MGINFYEYHVRPRCDIECLKEYKSAPLFSLLLSSFLFFSLLVLLFPASILERQLSVLGGGEGRRFDCVTATLVDCSRPFFSAPLLLLLLLLFRVRVLWLLKFFFDFLLVGLAIDLRQGVETGRPIRELFQNAHPLPWISWLTFRKSVNFDRFQSNFSFLN